MSKQAKILLIYTGGTIGMIEDFVSKQLKPFDFKHLSKQIPELKKLSVQLTAISFKKPLDSSNIQPSVWIKLVEMIEKNYQKYDGFVILHGSDTMSYTASALSFMLENLSKPVILTGSQLPIGVIRTDGKENLITAIEIAATNKKGKALVPEVAIYFEYKLYRGNRTRKFNAAHFEAFRSPNYPLLAEAGVKIDYNESAIIKAANKKLKVHKRLNSNIAILKIFPGITPQLIYSILSTKALKALVLETFGSGNAPTDKWFIDALDKAIKKGMLILNVTQCSAGAVMQGKYETSALLDKIGVISGKDITTEAAITKLMHLLATDLTPFQIKKLLTSSIRGEIS